MKNKEGRIIYVGKAVSLRKRVSSYFNKKVNDVKTQQLVKEIAGIDYIVTASEAEALILEASLVKQYHPKYNIDLKDDKSYPFIVISNDEFPRIFIDRPRVKVKGYDYFGPYVNAKLIREALHILRRIFMFRTCQPFPLKECLDYHMALCSAPCIGKLTSGEYAKNIYHVRLVLEGKKDELYRRLRLDMERFSRDKNFEQAAQVRNQLQAIGALYSGTQEINYFKEAEQLERLLRLPRRPERIEAFDISHTYGAYSVGAMISFFNGSPDKKNYRRFRIKTVSGIDDFKMIAEVVSRRYARLKKEGRAFPDLIVIDGGKGQLSAALSELKKIDIDIPIISLAKKEEEIFISGKKQGILLSENSLALKLLQRVRDEAHRFAVSYHRLLRTKNMTVK